METILTTLLRSLHWQGGTIHQVIEVLPREHTCINAPYRYGYRDGKNREHGLCFTSYSIPFNSWNDEPAFNLSYARGLYDGLRS